MGRSRSAIQNEINSNRDLLNIQNAKIGQLTYALDQLKSVDVEAEWKGKSHSHIKHTYKLAGTPYSDMSDKEEEIITTLNKSLKSKRDEMVGAVTTALSTAQSLASGYQNILGNLYKELAHAKD